MLYNDNLEELIFNRHEFHDVDEIIILSGYVGPNPIQKLRELPFPSRVIYGMYGSEGIQRPLHDSILRLQNSIESLNVFYSNTPVHSKCYAWRNRGNIVHALVGSANFSSNGLRTPFREILAETTRDTFDPLNRYISEVLRNSISCLEVDDASTIDIELGNEICHLSLVDRYGNVPETSGLNWGQNPKNHTNRNDAYIAVRVNSIRSHPDLFPPKELNPLLIDRRGRITRQNEAIEIIWDDGISMEGLLEGTQPIEGIIHPKQISSFPFKRQMGEYFRRRLRVP